MLVVSYYFVAWALIKLYEVATECFSLNGAISPLQLWELGLRPDRPCVALNLRTKLFVLTSNIEKNIDVFSRVEIGLELLDSNLVCPDLVTMQALRIPQR